MIPSYEPRTGLQHAVERIAALYDQEVQLREQARHLELEPTRREAAQGLFRRANGLRKARLALLKRCELL